MLGNPCLDTESIKSLRKYSSYSHSAKHKLSLQNADSTEIALKRHIIDEARKLPCYFSTLFSIQHCEQEEQCTSVGIREEGVVLVTKHTDKQGEYLKALRMIM